MWSLPDHVVDKGREEYKADLELVNEYHNFGVGLDVEELFVPEYLMRKG